MINRVLAHHIQHSTVATCMHCLRQAAEADQVAQGRVHCIRCRKTNSCSFGHGCGLRSNDPIFPGVASATCMQCECPERAPIPCDTSDLHAPCCAAQQLACVPGPKPRRETRDANAEEATGEKQLLRLERPFQTAVATYNVIQNARGFLTKQVMRCRARLTAPLGRAQPPLSTTPYTQQTSSQSVRGSALSQCECLAQLVQLS